MATNIPAVRVLLLQERQVVVEEIALFDMADEIARQDAAEATFQTAKRQFEKASRRWGLVNEKLDRLEFLDKQIELITP